MVSAGLAVYAIDVPGCGHRGGGEKRWARLKLKATLAELELLLPELQKRYPQKPLYLLGESLGGLLALRLCSGRPGEVNGVVASAPAWRAYISLPIILTVLLFPLIGKRATLKRIRSIAIRRTTNDLKVREQLLTAPEHRWFYTPWELLQIWLFAHSLPACARSLTATPILMLQGVEDRVIKPSGSCVLFKGISNQDKQLVLLQNSGHLTFEEIHPERQLLDLLLHWLKERAPQRVPQRAAAQPAPQPCGFWFGASSLSNKTAKLFRLAGLASLSRLAGY